MARSETQGGGLVHPVSTVEHCQVCWKMFVTPVAIVAHCRAVHRLEIGQQPALGNFNFVNFLNLLFLLYFIYLFLTLNFHDFLINF